MKPILIIDIETTGFQPTGKIVEIGIVSLDLDTGDIKTLFDQVTHEKGITREEVEKSWIVANSSLTVEDIRNSKELEVYRPEIQKIINDHPLGATAYNNAFDFGFLDDRKFTFPKKLACPMKAATPIMKLSHKYAGYKWPSVEEAWKYYIDKPHYREKHRGADDAIHECRIVYEMYKKGHFKI